MKFQSVNEMNHFDFTEAVLQKCEREMNRVVITLDNVKILPEHSLNRDIVTKRTNDFVLTFHNVAEWKLVEEGYTLYDAELRPYKKVEDRVVDEKDIAYDLSLMEECYVDEVVDDGEVCTLTWVVADHTWSLTLHYKQNKQEWDRWISL